MTYDSDLIAGKLRRWEHYLEDFNLPDWNEIPNIGLYMEQVISLLTDYLDYLPPEIKNEQQIITPAAINNYVRAKIMPSPEKKKYYRIHIAYLIMICTLKQTLGISVIRKIIPAGIGEEEVKDIYQSYKKRHKIVTTEFIETIRALAGPILQHENCTDTSCKSTDDLITTSAVTAGFYQVLAEKLLLLKGKTIANGGSIEIREPRK